MKRILSVFLSLLMLLMLVPATAFAADFTVKLVPSLTEVKAGDKFNVKADVAGAPFFAGYTLKLTYDPTCLEAIEGTWEVDGDEESGYIRKGAVLKAIPTVNTETPGVTYVVYSSENNTARNDGTMFTLYFKVKSTASNGATEIKVDTDEGQTWNNAAGDNLFPDYVNTSITVTGGSTPATVAVTGVTVDETASVEEGKTTTLTATVAPANATNKDVTWSSSDDTVATVDANGKVTAKKAGTATITVETTDGGKTATCVVTVNCAGGTFVKKQDASCTEEGMKAHWFCENCGKYFADNSGKRGDETTAAALKIDALNHKDAVKTPAVTPTCMAGGNYAYWYCDDCKTYFEDNEDAIGAATTLDKVTLGVDSSAHDFDESKWEQSETQHWYACKNGCEEKNAVADHSWEVVKTGATATGHKVVCTVCGYEKTEDHAHDGQWQHDGTYHWKTCGCGTKVGYVEHSSTGANVATCDSKAKCDDCGVEYGEFDYTVHTHGDLTKTEAKAATCVAAGNKAYWTCSACQKVYKDAAGTEETTVAAETLAIDSNAHNIDTNWTTEGGEHFHKCLNKGCTHKADEAACSGGTATCKAKAVCSVCNQAYGDFADHNYGEVTYTWSDDSTTCTASRTCQTEGCGYKDTEIATAVESNVVAATCKDKGSKTMTATFKNTAFATQTETNVEIPIDAAHHTDLKHTEAKAATCTADGNIEYYYCSGCRNYYSDDKGTAQITTDVTLTKLGHDWSDEWTEGETTHWHACTRTGCSAKNGETAHVFNQEVKAEKYLAAAGDCTTPNTYYKSCVCGAVGTEIFQDNAPGHNTAGAQWQSDGTKHWKVCATCHKHVDEDNCSGGTATCTAKAVCTTCGKEYGNIDSNNHAFTKQDTAEKYLASPASCTAKAQYYYSCTRCGEEGTVTFEYGNLLPHTYNKEEATENYLKTPATCTTQAVYYKSCECGEKGTATFKYGDLLSHTYDQEVVNSKYLKSGATCTAKAVYYKSCTCGAVDKSEGAAIFESGNLLPHSLVKTPAVAQTCTAAGNNEYWTCSVCKQVFKADKTTLTTVDAETLTKLGHNMTETPAKAATCTTDGNNEYWTCSRCNKYFKDEAGTQETTVAAETLPKLGHDFTKKVVNDAHRITPANCQHAAVYKYECAHEGCQVISDTETFAYGATDPHTYIDGKCKDCGAVNPMKDVKTGNIAPATEVGGETVVVEEGKQIVADDSGLAIKTDSGVVLNDVKEAVAAGNTKVTIDEKINTTITATEADKTGTAAVEALKEISGVTEEQKAELDKIVVELESYNANAAKKNAKVEQVVDVSLELVKVGTGDKLGEVKNVAQPIEIRIPASQSLINAFNNSNKVVKAIISHTEVNGDVTSKEVDVTYDESTGEAVIRMDAFSTVAFVTYENVGGGSHSSGSSTPTGARTITTDLPVGSINAVFVNGKKLDSKYYVINGSSVTLTEAYMSTLKAGRYTIRIENATHMSTATIEVAADGVLSARTGDMGLGMWYAMLTVSALLAVALVVKKRREA